MIMTTETIAASSHERRWLAHADAVGAFHRRHGRWPFRIANDPAEATLGHWLSRNRAQARDGQFSHLLSQTRLAYMDATAPGWRATYEENWKLRADELATFRRAHGAWPRSRTSDRSEVLLARWLGNQRFASYGDSYAAEFMTPHRRAYLSTVAPGWGLVRELDWRANADDLASFHRTHGRLPRAHSSDPDEQRLGRWLERQHAQERGMRRPHRFTPSRRRYLDLVVPHWRGSVRDNLWTTQARAVATFYRNHGALPRMRHSDPEQRTLALWLSNQRALARGTRGLAGLAPQRRARLDKVAPGWLPEAVEPDRVSA